MCLKENEYWTQRLKVKAISLCLDVDAEIGQHLIQYIYSLKMCQCCYGLLPCLQVVNATDYD